MKKIKIYAVIFMTSLSLSLLIAQENNEDVQAANTVIVTATRSERNTFEVPYTSRILDQRELINRRMVRDFPEALKEEGVSVQKTSNGQGSPYIRGFTGFRNLLMVDGIRVNNSTMRDGPNQYWGTIDPYSLQRMELVRGPSSVLHGSDAIGGAVNAITLSPNEKKDYSWQLFSRYASAENSSIYRISDSMKITDGNFLHVGGTRKHFGDVKAGDGSGRQYATNYDELNLDVKYVSHINESATLTLSHQRSFLDDVWRNHKTIFSKSWHGTTSGSDLHRIQDLERNLTYGRLEVNDPFSGIDKVKVTASHQLMLEDQDRLRSNGRREFSDVKVQTLGLQTQVDQSFDNHYLVWGFDYYRDNVDSHFKDYNADGTIRTIDPRGSVADNSTYGLLGVYLQDEIKSDNFTFIPGVRYTYADIDADKVDQDPSDATPYSRVSKDFEKVTGSFRTTYKPSEKSKWRSFFGVSQGFRAPNLSDYTRFDTARTNEIQTPTQSLDPEEYIAFELGTRFHDPKMGKAEVAYFYTVIDDYIIRKPTGNVVNGGNEVKAANGGEGFVEGVELNLDYYVTENITLFGSFNWNRGQVDDFTTSDSNSKDERHLSRIAPKNGKFGTRWNSDEGKYWIEGLGLFSRSQDKLAPRDVTDTDRVPRPNGTPGYNIYTIRGGWNFYKEMILSAGVENLTDKAYRPHGSGQNEPGRNYVVALDVKF